MFLTLNYICTNNIKRNCKAWKNKQKEDKNQKKGGWWEHYYCYSVGRWGPSYRTRWLLHSFRSLFEWVINSTAFCDVTPRKELFTSYKAGNFGRVKMGNDSYADIVGIGDICVRANTGYTLIFEGCETCSGYSLEFDFHSRSWQRRLWQLFLW